MEKENKKPDIPTVVPPDQMDMDPSVVPEFLRKKDEKMENRPPAEKPFVARAPGSKKETQKDENDPNPDSDPNYQYFPNVPYPSGPDEAGM